MLCDCLYNGSINIMWFFCFVCVCYTHKARAIKLLFIFYFLKIDGGGSGHLHALEGYSSCSANTNDRLSLFLRQKRHTTHIYVYFISHGMHMRIQRCCNSIFGLDMIYHAVGHANFRYFLLFWGNIAWDTTATVFLLNYRQISNEKSKNFINIC